MTPHEWLAAVLSLVRYQGSTEQAQAQAKAYATMLASYPERAFNRETLDAAAKVSGWWPSYAEVCTVLDAWMRDNRPPAPRLAAPVVVPIPADAWRGGEEMRATLAGINRLAGTAPHAAMLRALRSAVEAHAPELLAEIDAATPLGPKPVPSEAPPPAPIRALKPEIEAKLAAEARQRVARVRADEQDEGGSFW